MYSIRGFQTSNTENGCDAEMSADTLVDAKRQARYMLSAQYARICEATDQIQYAQVWKGDVLIWEA